MKLTFKISQKEAASNIVAFVTSAGSDFYNREANWALASRFGYKLDVEDEVSYTTCKGNRITIREDGGVEYKGTRGAFNEHFAKLFSEMKTDVVFESSAPELNGFDGLLVLTAASFNQGHLEKWRKFISPVGLTLSAERASAALSPKEFALLERVKDEIRAIHGTDLNGYSLDQAFLDINYQERKVLVAEM